MLNINELIGFGVGGSLLPIIYVGGVAATTTSTTTLSGALSGGVSASPAPGDLVVVIGGGWTGTGAGVNLSIEGPDADGFTRFFYGSSTGSAQYDGWAQAEYKFMGEVPDTYINKGYSTIGTIGTTYVIQVWRNVDSIVFDVPTVGSVATATGDPNPPSITPLTPGSVIIAGGAGHGGSGESLLVAPAGMQNSVTSKDDASSYDAVACIASIPWTGGTYDPGVFTSSGIEWGACTFALRPKTG